MKQILSEEFRRMQKLAGIINEDSGNNYEILNKETKKSEFGDEVYDNYTLKLNDETYTTPDELTFQLKTLGYVSSPEGEELDFNKLGSYFYYIETIIFDENGKKLEKIPGEKIYGQYELAASLNKAKNWLNQNGTQLTLGKGFQRKST